ncbi:MAG: hypothetical protein HOU01_12135 [Streptomycetaceae bacterium]|nr:hypothetical protein [Streptomycetaceae bacterium]
MPVPELPVKRQSIRPPRVLLLVVAAVLLLFAVIWGAVTWAVSDGKDSCPTRPPTGAASERCR